MLSSFKYSKFSSSILKKVHQISQKEALKKKGPEKNQKYTDNKKKQAQSMKKKTNTKQVSGICFQDRSEV